eukprot:scaffold259_cov158-Amphora_coffeaeformis.AAC.5
MRGVGEMTNLFAAISVLYLKLRAREVKHPPTVTSLTGLGELWAQILSAPTPCLPLVVSRPSSLGDMDKMIH